MPNKKQSQYDQIKPEQCSAENSIRSVWINSFYNELGRLTKDILDFQGTNYMKFTHHKEIPKKKIACSRFFCTIRPQKEETNRTYMTIGDNILFYERNTKTPTADIITIKILLKRVLSTPGAKFMTIVITNLYLKPS